MLFENIKCPNCGYYHDPTLEKCPACYKHNDLYLNRKINDKVAFLHPAGQAGLFFVGFAYTGMLIAELIIGLIFGLFITDELLYKTLTLFFTYLAMLLGLATIILTTRRGMFLKKYTRGLDYLYGIGYAVTLFLASSIVSNIISLFYSVSDNTNQSTAVMIAVNYPIIAFLIMGIMGPICEELTYRVGLYSFFRRFNKYIAIAVSAIVFGFIHFDFGAANIANEFAALPVYLVSGVVLGIAYEHRGPACSMTAHLLYNIFAFFMMLIV